MKNIKSENIIKLMYIVFIIWSVATIVVISKNIESKSAIIIVIGYSVYLFVMVFYLIIKTLMNIRSLKLREIRKRFIKFIVMAVILGGTSCAIDYFFRPEKFDSFRSFSISISLTLGICFFDIAFKKKLN
ncbi:hypothetical protein [Clostridium paridis]|uniref:Protein export membrane protein SecD/SecF C-terminal domain-containing protein n=1 Tax=Clostridium paridis TaxID=2803863 RepID=A0A937K3D0_9CLOT|nr:hypothetical protein [Clostridium paridis]MBL4930358.1 hypothetical protein [Clostridium paridis]